MFASFTSLLGGGYVFPYELGVEHDISWGRWKHFNATRTEDGKTFSCFKLSAKASESLVLEAGRNGIKRLRMVCTFRRITWIFALKNIELSQEYVNIDIDYSDASNSRWLICMWIGVRQCDCGADQAPEDTGLWVDQWEGRERRNRPLSCHRSSCAASHCSQRTCAGRYSEVRVVQFDVRCSGILN